MPSRSFALPFSVAAALLLATAALAQTTTRDSLSSTGTQDSLGGVEGVLSADGRFLAFRSTGALVPGDTNGKADVLVRDRLLGQTTRVSVGTGGVEGNGQSSLADISTDGRYVCFQSTSSNLVANDTNAAPDIFRHDRVTGITIRCSVGHVGQQAVWGTNGSISGDGRYVIFQSPDNALVPVDNCNVDDVFCHDCVLDTTVLISHGTGSIAPRQNPRISADGNFVVFESFANDLVPNDTNGKNDIFLWSRATDGITIVSLTSAGAAANDSSSGPAVSADGRFVAFASQATNFFAGDTISFDIFVRDTVAGTTTVVSSGLGGALANNASIDCSISGDGRFVTFQSSASNLVAGDTNNVGDVFVHDRATGVTSRASVTVAGAQATGTSQRGRIATNGRFVAFQSIASNLVSPDTNTSISDVYVRDLGPVASAGSYGSGCPGSGTIVPVLGNVGWPVIGNAGFALGVSRGLASSLAVVFWNTAVANVALSGCDVLVAPPINTQPVVPLDAAGAGIAPFPIPNDVTLVGVDVFFQSLVIDPLGPFLGLGALSNGVAAHLGN